ncbi:MAG: hypothetical protein JWM80_6671 [Cyanobacteria bacterium RYN_339]|nr:hypothetical protein [Cyanobacteria bacterium RYN_339]
MIWDLVVVAQTNFAMDQEAGQRFLAADKQLNQAYQRLLPKLPAPARAKLANAQIRWIKFRDAWAEVRMDAYRGGTAAKTVYTDTRTAATTRRTQDFADVLAQVLRPRRVGEGVQDQVLAVDKQLNTNYQAYLASIDAPGRKLATVGQLAWLAYRDAELAFTESWRHDAGARANRLYELTQQQADELANARQP